MKNLFIKELLQMPNWSPADVTMFHVLPDAPYRNGIYEVTARELARLVNVSHGTAAKFLRKVEESDLVEVLRALNARSRAGLAFMRKESTLHKKNYRVMGELAPSRDGTFIISMPRHRVILPNNFFKRPLSPNLHRELLPLLTRGDLRDISVHRILDDYIIAPEPHSAERSSRHSLPIVGNGHR